MPGARRKKKGQTQVNPSAEIRTTGSGYSVSTGPDNYDGRANTAAGSKLNPETPTRATGIVVNVNEK